MSSSNIHFQGSLTHIGRKIRNASTFPATKQQATEASPSTSELLAIVSLIPPDVATNTTPSLLPNVLSFFRTKWLRDFLFSTSPLHISHLSAPDLPLSAFLLSLVTTRVERPSPLPNPHSPQGDSTHARTHLLFAPAFTADNMTVGVGVLQGSDTVFNPWAAHLPQTHQLLHFDFRFVRDATKHTFLIVSDIPQLDTVAVFCSWIDTPSTNSSFTGMFHRAKLFDALDGGCHEDNIRAAAQCIIDEVRVRSCPMCAMSSPNGCSCSLTTLSPAHPFDTQYFRDSCLQTLGTYEGSAHKTTRCHTEGEQHVPLGVRIELQCSTDADLIERMSKCSIAGHMRTTVQDPRLSNLLTVSEELPTEERLGTSHDENIEVSITTSRIAPEAIFFDGTGDDVAARSVDPVLDPQTEIQSICFAMPEPDYGADSFFECLLEPEQTVGISTGATDAKLVDAIQEDSWWDKRCIAAYRSGRGQAVESTKDLNIHDYPSRIPGAEALNRPIAACRSAEDGVRSAHADMKALERRVRAEKRRERNRASAQINNLKRKTERDFLKMELSTLKEKIEFLRGIEVSLRQENVLLRRSIVER